MEYFAAFTPVLIIVFCYFIAKNMTTSDKLAELEDRIADLESK